MLAIKTERASELDRLADWHGRGRCVLATLTLRHGFGDDLRQLRRALSKAWELCQQGRGWKKWKEKVGFVGSVRALEVTHGYAAGWHPHLHVLFLVDDAKDPRWPTWTNQLRERWIAACERLTETDRPRSSRFERLPPAVHVLGAEADALFRALDLARRPMLERSQIPDWEHGVVLTYGSKESYLAKLGLELSDAGGKHAKEGRRTPLAIGADYVRAHRARDGELWRTYSKAFFRARCLTWSKGLKDEAGIEDVTDQDAAETRVGEWICRVEGSTWDTCRRLAGFKSGLLEAVELGGAERARLFVQIARLRAGRVQLPPATLERPAGEPIPWRDLRDSEPVNDTAPAPLAELAGYDAELRTPAMLELRTRSDAWYCERHREQIDDAKARLLEQYVPGRLRGDELGGPVWPVDAKILAAVRRRYSLAVQGLDPMKPNDPEPSAPMLPFDLDTEGALLSAALVSKRHLDDLVSLGCAPSDFYSIANRRIWEAILLLVDPRIDGNRTVDAVLVAAVLRRRNEIQQVGGVAYLGRLIDSTPAIAHVGDHFTVLRGLRCDRDAIAACQELAARLYAGEKIAELGGAHRERIESAQLGDLPNPGNVVPLRGRSG